MNVALTLSALPLWVSVPLVVGVPTAVAMLCSLYVRRHVGTERLMTNNEVAGFKFATIGVIYAVLLGFAVIVVWEKFRDAEAVVTDEAGAVVALYRLSGGMEEGAGVAIRDRLTAYAKAVIDDDWPAMAHGRLSAKVTRTLNALYATVLAEAPDSGNGSAVTSAIFGELDKVTAARRERFVLARGVVPGVVWLVLFLGAVLTIGFTFFFGTQNVRAQVLMTGLLAALIFMGLLVIISIERPFTGPVSVPTESFTLLLHEFAGGG